MSLHDEYARVTPFELALPSEERVQELMRAVAEEAEGRGVDPAELDGFLTLGSVDAFVREIAGDDPDPTALHRFGPLAYHGVRFAGAGRPLYVLTTHVARYVVEGVPGGEPKLAVGAGYLQLPQHLFWTRAAGESPESVDGVFWSSTPSGALHALLATGIRPDRPGLGVVPLPAGPLSDARRWLELDGREEGTDFETDLPGAEIDALYEIRTAGEVFKLLARFFAYVDASPEGLVRHHGARSPGGIGEDGEGEHPSGAGDEGSPGADGEGPTASRLDYVRVTLDPT